MRIPMLRTWFGDRPFATVPSKDRSAIRVGIPKVLNIWSTHQFWSGFLTALGIKPHNIVFSEDTSEAQFRTFGKGRSTVESCYPVKCISGHYGELVFGQKKKLDVLLSPMIYSLPSFLHGHVVDTLACPRVMAAPENIKAGFMKEGDVFAEQGIRYVTPFVSLGEPRVVPQQLYTALKNVLELEQDETKQAVAAGYKALDAFNHAIRGKGREILTWCAQKERPCILVLGRPDVAILFRTHGDKSNRSLLEVCSMSKPAMKGYPAEFKERAVKLAVESDQPIAQTARDLGVNENTLHTSIGKYHWAVRQREGGP